MQTPPAFSAIHTEGQRAYTLARKGHDVELAARPVRIDRIVAEHYQWPFLDVRVDCGAGTYIRSIARDLGQAVATGGMIETLRRTAIGPFQVSQARPIEELLDFQDPAEAITPSATALVGWPQIVLTEEETALVARGRPIPIPECVREVHESMELALMDASGLLAGLARAVPQAGAGFKAQPYRVFLSQE